MKFTVSWPGNSKATLLYLLHNEVPVLIEGKKRVDKHQIVIAYVAPNYDGHSLAWGLRFPNKSHKRLVATLSISGGDVKVLANTKDKSHKHRWDGSGDVE